jgi:hypothetical protein
MKIIIGNAFSIKQIKNKFLEKIYITRITLTTNNMRLYPNLSKFKIKLIEKNGNKLNI